MLVIMINCCTQSIISQMANVVYIIYSWLD
jgi:hypothetical protein